MPWWGWIAMVAIAVGGVITITSMFVDRPDGRGTADDDRLRGIEARLERLERQNPPGGKHY